MTRPAEFSYRVRARNLEALSRDAFDLLVIGGGITGAGVARDAALRGLSVGLVERRDFAGGTSSRSSKLVHGGLRYLPQGDVGLVREAATERYAVRKLAPHLARPVQLMFPTRSRGGHAKLKVGLWTYDRLAGVCDEERSRMVSREEALEIEPKLRPKGVYGAAVYYEYVTEDARLVIEVMKSAAALGAVIANHAEVTGFVVEDGRVAGITLRDHVSGSEFAARARVVVNAAGPWVDSIRLLSEPEGKPRLRLTKGIHLGLRTRQMGLSNIVVMNARDRRGVFAVPRREVTYLGTTDTDYLQPEDYPYITVDDAEYLLDAANRTFAVDPPLTREDVVSAWAGLRPLLHQEGKKPSELSRKDEIMLNDAGLVSIAGGKLTTFRKMAERAVDMVCERLQEQGQEIPERKGDSEEIPLSGGETGDDVDAYATRLAQRWPDVAVDAVDRLVEMYGSNAERLVEEMSAHPALAERYVPRLPLTRAEVEYGVCEEMAMGLEDFLERRSRLLLWDPDNGLAVAEGVARTMGAMLGWDEVRIRAEVSAYRDLAERLTSFREEEAQAEVRAAHA